MKNSEEYRAALIKLIEKCQIVRVQIRYPDENIIEMIESEPFGYGGCATKTEKALDDAIHEAIQVLKE